MNTKLKLFSLLFITAALAGCDAGSESPFSPGSSDSSSTNAITLNKLTIAVDNTEPGIIEVTFGDATPATNNTPVDDIFSINSTTIGEELVFTAFGADSSGFKTSGNNMTFRSNYGSIESSCTLTDGSCTVTLTTLGQRPPITDDPFTGKEEIVANIVVYTLGEESYFDANGNGVFDDGDTFGPGNDVDEPYLDNNNNNVFDQGIDEPIDINNDGIHNGVDGLYSGNDCQHPTLCSPSPSITIWTNMDLTLSTE